MTKFKRTREFFSDGGIIFGHRKGRIASIATALGLAAGVIFMPDVSNAQPLQVSSKLPHVGENAKPISSGLYARVMEMKAKSAPAINEAPTKEIATEGVAEVIDDAVDYLELIARKVHLNYYTSHEFEDYKVPHYVAADLVQAAKDFEFDVPLLFAIAERESSWRTGVQSTRSTATGLFQFVEQTWLESVKIHAEKLGLEHEAALIKSSPDGRVTRYYVEDEDDYQRIMALRKMPYYSAAVAIIRMKNAIEKIEAQVKTVPEDAYLPHFLGDNGSMKLLAHSVKKPKVIAAKLLPSAAKANREKFRAHGKLLNVAQFRAEQHEDLRERKQKYLNVEEIIAEAEKEILMNKAPEQIALNGPRR